MTGIPNCSTCPHYITKDGGLNYCEIILLTDPKANHWDITKRTKVVGCLFHPDARAYLMAPVLKELEIEVKEQRMLEEHYKGHHSEIHKKIGDALEYAIALIKNGVK